MSSRSIWVSQYRRGRRKQSESGLTGCFRGAISHKHLGWVDSRMPGSARPVTHPQCQKPVLLATQGRQLVFSVVGWMIAYRESTESARHIIDYSFQLQNIAPGQLTAQRPVFFRLSLVLDGIGVDLLGGDANALAGLRSRVPRR